MPRRGRTLALVLLVAGCSRPPPSQAPVVVTAASEPVAASEVVSTPPTPPPQVAEDGADDTPEEPTWPAEHMAIRTLLAAHPGEIPSVMTLDDVTLILLRGAAAATLCIVVDSTERCYRTATAVHAARLMVPEEDDFEATSQVRAWLKIDGANYRVDEEGAVKPGGRPPRGFWAKVGVQRSHGPRRGARTLQEVPAEDLPLAELVEVAPEESTSLAGPVLTADELLCVHMDDAWRCAASPFAEGQGDARPLRYTAVRGASGAAVAIEVEECASGSELTDCQRSLRLFAVVGPELREAAHLPLGAEIDERVRDRDDDDLGGWVSGTRETYRRGYTLATPTCVRLTRTVRTHEAYTMRFRDHGGSRNTTRKLPLASIPADAPNELPFRAELDAYADPPDLRGLWQLRGERWLRVDVCDP